MKIKKLEIIIRRSYENKSKYNTHVGIPLEVNTKNVDFK